jgi:uncharacterized membrane protein
MGCRALFIFLLIILPVLLLLLFLDIATISFTRLGLSRETAIMLLLLSLVGSVINIPIWRRRVVLAEPAPSPLPLRIFFYTPPEVSEQIVAINLGGAIVPIGFASYLLATRAPVAQAVIATALVAVVAKLIARPVRGVGIVMPVWIPPLLSVGLALLLAPYNKAAVAYVSGSMCTLIGADLLNFGSFRKLGAHMLSIGGAGVFDGIFLVGIAAALLT